MKTKSKDTRKLVILSIMVAFTIILDYTPIGMIPLPFVSASIVHLPTVITGIILGPIAGVAVGGFMGVINLIHAATRPPSILAPLFINPLVSILPRLFIGVASYYAFAAVSKLLGDGTLGKKLSKRNIAVFVGAFIGSMTNTVLVLSALWIIYGERVSEMVGQNISAFVITTATTQGVLEALVIAVITVPIVVAYHKVNRKK